MSAVSNSRTCRWLFLHGREFQYIGEQENDPYKELYATLLECLDHVETSQARHT